MQEPIPEPKPDPADEELPSPPLFEEPPPPPIPELLTRPVKIPRREHPGSPEPEDKSGLRQASAWALASNFAFGVVGMSLVGWAIQKWVWPGGAPWVVLAFAGLGLVGGSYVFVRDAIRMNQS